MAATLDAICSIVYKGVPLVYMLIRHLRTFRKNDELSLRAAAHQDLQNREMIRSESSQVISQFLELNKSSSSDSAK